jgi:hypothetical protein
MMYSYIKPEGNIDMTNTTATHCHCGVSFGSSERDALVERFASRIEDKHRLHNQLMFDYDTMGRAELTALADGLRWITWEAIDRDEDDEEDQEGFADFSHGPVTDGGVCKPEFFMLPKCMAEELADLLHLEEVESSTGVDCWGDFS